ncbi:MAG: MerR family transcriptional regulator [Hungatella sp.]|jgi:DNA-binding transcriptional MerR regulator|nr:MerR family transcriptional regulator [Hungatella sp.]
MIEWTGRGTDELKRFQKGSQEIGIFELSNLFGITTEALRKYEAKKILQPYRGKNKYRKYSTWELTKIIRVRQLRQEGFPLSDIADELERGGPARQLRKLEDMQEQLRGEIAYREKLIQWLSTRQKEIAQTESLGDKCVIECQSRRYCCVYMVSNTLVDKKGCELEHLKEWVQAMPFVRVCHIGSPETTISCLTLEEAEVEQYGLQYLAPDFMIPQQSCVVCNMMAEHSQEKDTSVEGMQQAREKALRLGLQLTDEAVFQMIWYSQRDGISQSHNKAIFPIVD